jgi:BASS family bile acid:Na+ symporter
LLHNALALITGYLTAKITRLNSRDVKTITIETGIQNSGLGLLIIFTFFDGMGPMALITAWWGIWHLISGIVSAIIFRRFKISQWVLKQ